MRLKSQGNIDTGRMLSSQKGLSLGKKSYLDQSKRNSREKTRFFGGLPLHPVSWNKPFCSIRRLKMKKSVILPIIAQKLL